MSEDKKNEEQQAKVAFRGVSPFGQTAESKSVSGMSMAIPAGEIIEDVVQRSRSSKVRDVVGSVRPVLEQLEADAPDVELSQGLARALREVVAATAKEVLGKMKK